MKQILMLSIILILFTYTKTLVPPIFLKKINLIFQDCLILQILPLLQFAHMVFILLIKLEDVDLDLIFHYG